MHKALAGVGALVGALSPAATATAADTTVSLGNCVFANGGQVTRPAGSTIVARVAFATKTYGLNVNFLNAQTTAISVNGGPSQDVSSLYGAPTGQAADGWLTSLMYPTGVTLASPGDSMTFRVTLSLAHLFSDVIADGGHPLFGGPGLALDATCTVTAV
jgi:hypothetical protein